MADRADGVDTADGVDATKSAMTSAAPSATSWDSDRDRDEANKSWKRDDGEAPTSTSTEAAAPADQGHSRNDGTTEESS